MKLKKLQTALLAAVLSLSMLTGCTGLRSYAAVTDNTIYQFDDEDMTPCYLNNVMMYVDNDILLSDTLRGYADEYTLELYDDDTFILLCNMYKTSLDEMETSDARNCLADYFEATAVSLDLSKITGKYIIAEDISPVTGKTTDFYKIIFSGVTVEIDKTTFEGQAALLAYDDICVAAIVGTVDNGLSEAKISNMMKSVAIIESEDLSTGNGTRPTYEAPDTLLYDAGEYEEEAPVDDDNQDGDDDRNTDDNRNIDNSRTSIDLSEDIYATSVTIGALTLSYPFTYDDLLDAGMTPDMDADTLISGYESEILTFTLTDGGSIFVYFVNPSDENMPVSLCTVYGLNVDADFLAPGTTAVIGDSLILGETTQEEFLNSIPVTPDYEYESDSYYSASFERSNDDYSESFFDFYEGILTGTTMYFGY